jgi:hypothetical protein
MTRCRDVGGLAVARQPLVEIAEDDERLGCGEVLPYGAVQRVEVPAVVLPGSSVPAAGPDVGVAPWDADAGEARSVRDAGDVAAPGQRLVADAVDFTPRAAAPEEHLAPLAGRAVAVVGVRVDREACLGEHVGGRLGEAHDVGGQTGEGRADPASA